MNLEEARARKQQLQLQFDRREITPGSIAFGIATTDELDAYRIAVYVLDNEVLHSPFVEALVSELGSQGDVRVIGKIQTLLTERSVAAPVLGIGASIGHRLGSAGTLGFFAETAGNVVGIVSANHIIARSDRGNNLEAILRPAPLDGGTAANAIAKLRGNYPRLFTKGDKRVDCAFAPLINPPPPNPSELPQGWGNITNHVNDATDKIDVIKVGRTTQRTFGHVISFELDPIVYYTDGHVRFRDQIVIESSNADPFCSGGDSGSLVYDTQYRAVGLLFAASLSGGEADSVLGLANPIRCVLHELGVTIKV